MIKFPLRFGAALVCAVLASCDRSGERVAITESREISTHAPQPNLDISSSTRFYDDAPKSDGPKMRDLLTWTVPEGWDEVEGADPSGMRLLDLRFGPEKVGECYISLMPGAAGGLDANVNRWRTQMGQLAYTADEIAKLPKKPFFNREATFVEFDGDFTSFGATEAKKGYRLMGLIHSAKEATIFVKVTGPKDLVERNAAAFDAFCQSIHPNDALLK